MKWYAALIYLLIYVENIFGYEVHDFVCIDSTQIKLEEVCDGLKNCPDGSDETRSLCYHIICPPNKFRCHYGACIDKGSRCDGKFQCIDESDENHCGVEQDSCQNSEFRCMSHECISNNKVCDGISDCSDESDESENICDSLPCPEDTYRCKYGGCVHLDARCNGFQDCVDGSDESDMLCNSLKCSGKECNKVLNEIFCPPIISTRIVVTCEAKYQHKGMVPCDEPLPIGTIARYECKPYYEPASGKEMNNNHSVCQPDGTWNREHLKCEPECGRAAPVAAPLVVHGWIPEEGTWPWHATIYNLQNGNWKFWCGGSLISERVVLTAAHCTWKVMRDTLKVALGNFFSNYSKIEDFTQMTEIKEIIIQPLYQDILGNYGSDIAILVLSKVIQFSPFVSPVCIDWQLHDITEHLTHDTKGLILGMGITENDTFSETLRATYLPVVSDSKCIEAQSRDFKKYVTYTSFCAGWRNGTGACNGDSGGGLVFPRYANRSQWVLQGIVSVSPRRLGTSFCDPKYYTIFTKVGMYVDWIQNVLNKVHSDRIRDESVLNNVIL